jgi:hypothetical protein
VSRFKVNREETLEQRAVSAINDAALTAATASELIAELTGAIAAAKQEATAEEERALDPRLSPDLQVAREKRDDAQLKVGRLQTLREALQRRHATVRAQEEITAYEAKRDALQKEGDALQQELIDTYIDAASAICTLFQRAKHFQTRASSLLGYPPAGVDTLRKFDLGVQRVLEKVRLYDFADEQIWPPQASSLAVEFAQSLQYPSHVAGINGPIGPLWADEEVRARFRSRHEQEQERQKSYYEQTAKEQTDRANAEERDRFLATRRMNGE